jgi:hypothetical protein
MALWELLRALRRHLVIVGVGLVATFGALVFIHGHAGVYEARTGLVLVPAGASGKEIYLNPYHGRDYSLIATAGVLANVVNEDIGSARTSTSVPLSGRGVLDGYAVDLPNSGGQFAYDFDRPILDVQAVGPTPEAVRRNLATAVAAVNTALARLQKDAGVMPARRITTHSEPADPEVVHGRGRPTRALLAAMILGLGSTLAVVLVVDDHRGRRVHRARDRRVPVPA